MKLRLSKIKAIIISPSHKKIIKGSSLRGGRTKSCGCLQREIQTENTKKGYGESAFNNILNQYKMNAKFKGYEFSLTEDEFRELIFSNCYYCGRPPSRVRYNNYSNGDIIYTGIDRIENSRGYFKDNVRPCCRQCNFIKSKYTEEEFILLVKDIYEHLKLKSRV